MKPGKKIILILFIMWILAPINAIPEDIDAIIQQSDCCIINGKVFPASKNFGRIYYRVRKFQDHSTAMQFAEALSEKRLWKELTAIAEVESGFNTKAQSKNGKRFGYWGAFQVVEKEWGRIPKDVRGQCDQAETILKELLSQNKYNRFVTYRKYNGSIDNPATKVYATKVELTVRRV